MYLMGYRNPECIKYVEINNLDLYPYIEKTAKNTPIDGSTAFFIGDALKKGGFEFGKDYWMKKVDISSCHTFVFKITLKKKACFDEIERHLGSSLAYAIDNDTFFDSQTASEIYKLLNDLKFKENKDYSIDFIDKKDVETYILLGVEINRVYRKLEEYYQEGDMEQFKSLYPKVYEKIVGFNERNLPTFEEIKDYESKWKGFFERQGRLKDGLW